MLMDGAESTFQGFYVLQGEKKEYFLFSRYSDSV